MTLPAPVCQQADEDPLIARLSDTDPIATLARSAGVTALRGLKVHQNDGSLGALLVIGWDQRRRTPPEPEVLCRFAAVLPALQGMIDRPAELAAAVLVLHEDELVAHGIARGLEAACGLDVVASSDAGYVTTALTRDRPWIVVCSDHLAGEATLGDVATRARSATDRARIIVLAAACTPASIAEAEQAQADGYATLEPTLDQLIDVINAVCDGRATPLPEPQGAALTKREQQILQGLEEGLTYQEIAVRIGITLSTVKTQSRPLFRKLDVTSRAGAVHKARTQGLL